MGADLILTYTPHPHWPDGKTAELSLTVIAELDGRIDALSDDAVLRAWASTGKDDDEIPGYADNDPSEAELAALVRTAIKEAVTEVFTLDRRDINIFEIGGQPYLFTGGMSWGDTPSDIYDDVVLIGASGITETPIPPMTLTLDANEATS